MSGGTAEVAGAPEAGPGGDGDAVFRRRLAMVLLVALVVRVAYVLLVTRHDTHLYDALYYELQAQAIADGHGFFKDPFQLLHGTGRVLEAADHPPLTVLLLLPAAYLGGTELGMRFTMVLLGVLTVLLVALLAREVAGHTAGLLAAGVAAVDPNLWANDGLVMSESPGVLLATALLLLAYRTARSGVTARRVVGIGVVAGLGMLTRAEFALFLPLIALPALWVGSGRRWLPALRASLGTGAVVLVLVGPWVAYNFSRFDRPTLISTNDGLALRAANCPGVYHGTHLGWANVFPPCAQYDPDVDQSVVAERNRREAFEFVREEAGRFPVVAAARLGRSWHVFNIRQTAGFAEGEGRPVWVTMVGAVASWVLAALAVVGAVSLRRRRVRIWPLVTIVVVVNAVLALVAGGLLRYRVSAETAIVVLAAAGALALWERRRPVDRPTT